MVSKFLFTTMYLPWASVFRSSVFPFFRSLSRFDLAMQTLHSTSLGIQEVVPPSVARVIGWRAKVSRKLPELWTQLTGIDGADVILAGNVGRSLPRGGGYSNRQM